MAIDPIDTRAPLSGFTMKPRWAIGLCFLVAALVCLPALRGGFVIDDAYLVVGNPDIRSLGNIPGFFARPWGGGEGGAGHAGVNAAYFRPLTTTLHAVEFAVFGLRPWGWHLVSILLHAAATGLGTWLAARILGSVAAALVAGLVFAVHPVHTEAVAAVCYQTTLLAGLLAVLALSALARVLGPGKTTGRWVALAALATAAAGLAKEEAVVVPVLGAAWVLLAPSPQRRRVLLWGVGSMGLAAAAAIAVRSAIVAGSSITYFGPAGAGVVAPTMARVVALYAELLVAPFRLCPFYDWFIIPPSAAISAEVVLGLLLAVAVVLGVWLASRRAPGGAIGLGWMALGLLPVMHFVPILNVAAERFLYLPSFGFALALGALFQWACGRKRRLAFGAAVGLVLLFGARTLVRWPAWRDDRTLNQATAAAFPQTPTPLINLANLALAAGDRASALRYLEEAQRRAPGWPVAARMAEKLRTETSR